jgi:hypothetical protein
VSVLAQLQRAIEGLHGVQTQLDVDAYVVDPEVRALMPGARTELPEQLFVREDGDGMELALYVDPKIITTLEKDDPRARLHEGNLESYCVALEGVSHFVFLAFRAELGRPVTPLELEIQAEVDKFVQAWLLLRTQGCSLAAGARVLDLKLFVAYEVREGVASEEVERYHTATRAARRYCSGLAERHAESGEERRIRADVRGYYRSGLAEKLRAA